MTIAAAEVGRAGHSIVWRTCAQGLARNRTSRMSVGSSSTSSIIQISVHSACTCSRFPPSKKFKSQSLRNHTQPVYTHPKADGQAGAVQRLIRPSINLPCRKRKDTMQPAQRGSGRKARVAQASAARLTPPCPPWTRPRFSRHL